MNIVGNENDDIQIQLDENGQWTHHASEKTVGKQVHCHYTIVSTDHPEEDASLTWDFELDCSHGNQTKKGNQIPTGVKWSCEVNTNSSSDTQFDFTVTSNKGQDLAGYIVRLLAVENS